MSMWFGSSVLSQRIPSSNQVNPLPDWASPRFLPDPATAPIFIAPCFVSKFLKKGQRHVSQSGSSGGIARSRHRSRRPGGHIDAPSVESALLVAPASARGFTRSAHLMACAYDPVSHKVVIFGGYDSNSYLQETWTYNGSAWTLESPQVSPPAPPDRAWPSTR